MDTSTAVAQASHSTDTLGRRIVPRRFRSVAEKQRIVQEMIESGCSGAEVARRHGVNANLIFTWRRLHEQGLLAERTRRTRKATVRLLPVKVDAQGATSVAAVGEACVEIELPGGIRVRSCGAVDRAMLACVLSVLRR